MQKKYGEQLNRCAQIQQVMDDHPTAIKAIPKLTSIAALFTTEAILLRTLIEEQEATTKVVTVSKNQKRTLAYNLGLAISLKLIVLSEDEKDLLIAQDLPRSLSELRNAPELDAELALNRIKSKAITHLAQLAPYGVTQAKLDAFVAALTAYSTARSAPARARTKRTGKIDLVNEQLKKVQVLIYDNLLPLCQSLQQDYPDFVRNMMNAKQILHAPTKKRDPQATLAKQIEKQAAKIVAAEEAAKRKAEEKARNAASKEEALAKAVAALKAVKANQAAAENPMENFDNGPVTPPGENDSKA